MVVYELDFKQLSWLKAGNRSNRKITSNFQVTLGKRPFSEVKCMAIEWPGNWEFCASFWSTYRPKFVEISRLLRKLVRVARGGFPDLVFS